MSFHETLLRETAAARNAMLALPVLQDGLAGRVTRAEYVAYLTEAYHHVRHTVPLLMACGSRLPPRLEWLRTATAEYITEEVGHHEWVLDDIVAAGGDRARARDALPGTATELMVGHAYYLVDRANPVGFFGMVHVLEGTSVALATRAADSIERALALPRSAFSYLRSHGDLDQSHVGFFRELMDRLDDPGDRDAVVRAARTFYRLYGDVFASIREPRLEEAA